MKENMNLKALMQQPKRLARINPQHALLSPSLTMQEFQSELETTIQAAKVGELVKMARKVRKISVRDLAKKINVSHPRVLEVENSDSTLELQTLVRYANALGFKVKVSFAPVEGGKILERDLH